MTDIQKIIAWKKYLDELKIYSIAVRQYIKKLEAGGVQTQDGSDTPPKPPPHP